MSKAHEDTTDLAPWTARNEAAVIEIQLPNPRTNVDEQVAFHMVAVQQDLTSDTWDMVRAATYDDNMLLTHTF